MSDDYKKAKEEAEGHVQRAAHLVQYVHGARDSHILHRDHGQAEEMAKHDECPICKYDHTESHQCICVPDEEKPNPTEALTVFILQPPI